MQKLPTIEDIQYQVNKVYQGTVDLFNQHPNSVNQTYLEHMRDAFDYGITSCIGGYILIIHSIFPFVFKDTGSKIIFHLNDRLQAKISQHKSAYEIVEERDQLNTEKDD